MADNINATVEALISGLESYASTKTVLGEAITIDDTTIMPIAEITVGLAAGQSSKENKNNGTGGAGVKVNPAALLIIKNGVPRVVNLKEKDAGAKLLEMAPDLLSKVSGTKLQTIKDKINELSE